jgi:hypothetical protein
MTSILTLNNNMTEAATASVTLYNLKGQALVLAPIQLAPQLAEGFDLSQLTKNPDFRAGNVQITFNGMSMGIASQVSVISKSRRLAFESTEDEAMDFSSSRLHGILWLPDMDTQTHIALTNTTNTPLAVTAGANSHDDTKTVLLNPHGTEVLEGEEFLEHGRDASSSATLLTLDHNGSPGALMVTGFAINRETGFSCNLPFVDPSTAVSTHLAGAHVRMGLPSPEEGFPSATRFSAPLVLANVGNQHSSLTISVDYTVSSVPHRLQVGMVSLNPGQTGRLDLAQALGARGISGPLDDAGVDVDYTGSPGAVIGRLASFDQTGDFSFDVPIKDPLVGMGRVGGSYPWRLDDGFSTVVHLKNTINKPVHALVQVRYEGGIYNLERIPLAPFQTIALDIRALRDAQKRDIRQSVMPKDAMSGQVAWFEEDVGSVIGRAEVANIAGAIASSFSCGQGCQCPPSYSSCYLNPSSMTGAVGDTMLVQALEMRTDCNGVGYGPYNRTTDSSWNSSNTAIATAAYGGSISCVGVGSTSVYAQFSTAIYGLNCYVNTINPACSGPVTVPPTVQISFSGSGVPLSSGTPPQGSPAFVNSVTMTAQGNPTGGTYSWSTTSSKVTLSNTTSSTVTVTAASMSTSQNDTPIKVTYTVNGASSDATQNVTVQKPTSMGFVSVVSDAANTCSSGQAGWKKVIQWQVQDQTSHAVPILFALPTYDTLTAVQGHNACNLTLSGTAPGGATGSTGIWEHTYKFCTTLCSCETDSTQAFFVNGFEIDLSVVMKCDGITVAGH